MKLIFFNTMKLNLFSKKKTKNNWNCLIEMVTFTVVMFIATTLKKMLITMLSFFTPIIEKINFVQHIYVLKEGGKEGLGGAPQNKFFYFIFSPLTYTYMNL